MYSAFSNQLKRLIPKYQKKFRTDFEEELKINDLTQLTSSNIEERKNNEKEFLFSSNMKDIKDIKDSNSNIRTKYKSENNNYSSNTSRKRFKNNFYY